MKRVTCFLLALIMVVSVFPTHIFASAAENVGAAEEGSGVTVSAGAWTGAVATDFARGDGSYERPYIIEAPDQLAFLAQSVNGGTTYENRYIHLVTDLDMGSLTWTPIGTDANPFKGTFCGNGFTITNLTLGNVAQENGLFGKNDGYIKDVHLTNVKASYTATKLTDAYYAQVGALAGVNTGYIERCTADVDITVTCTVSGLDPRVGGLVGSNWCSIVASGTSGSVKLTGGTTNNVADVGGLLGHGETGESIVNRCYAKTNVTMVNGDAAGGLIGYAENIAVTGSYALGAVSGTSSVAHAHVGGLIGQYYGAGSAAKIQYCFSTGTVYAKASDKSYAGGLIGSYGNFTAGQFTNCYCGAPSVKAELTSATSGVVAQAGKMVGYQSSAVVPVKCYVNSATAASYQYYNSYETGGCNSQTVHELLPDPSDNSGFTPSGTFTYGTNNPASLVGFGAYSDGDWVDLSENNPRLYVEDTLDYTVRYSIDGEVFATAHARVYPGETVSFTSPAYEEYEPDTAVVDGTVTQKKLVDVYYYPKAHNLMLICKDEDGNVIHTESASVREGYDYSIPAPAVKGHLPVEETVTGTMGEGDAYITVSYTRRKYDVTILYLYADETTAAQRRTAEITYGEKLIVESPTVIGYKPNISTVTLDTRLDEYASQTDIVLKVYYLQADEESYTVVAMLGDKRLPDVTVTFNGESKQTDELGQATFTYPYGLETVTLQLKKEGYINTAYDSATEYTLNKAMGIDYFSLKVNTEDNPHYSVSGISCFGNDIDKNYGVINVNYDELIPIVVNASAAASDTITMVKLVQHVDKAKTSQSSTASDMVAVVLQTLTACDEGEPGYYTFKVKGTRFKHSDDKEYPIFAYMYTEDLGAEPLVKKLQINTTQIQTNFKFKGFFEEAEFSLKDTGIDMLENTKISFELDDKYKLNFPFSFEVLNNEVYVGYDMSDDFKEEMKSLNPKGYKKVQSWATRADTFMKNMANKLDKKFEGNKRFNTKSEAAFEIDAEMAGCLCFTVRPGSAVEMRSYVKLTLTMQASWTTDFWIVFVPITVRVDTSLSGEVTITGIGFDFESQQIQWPDQFGVDLGWQLTAYAGIGNRVLSAGVLGRIQINTTLQLGKKTSFDLLVLNGEVGGYARLNCGLFELYGELTWKFLDKKITLVEQSAYMSQGEGYTLENGSIGTYMGLPVYEASGYTLGSGAEEETAPEWTVTGATELDADGLETAEAKILPVDGGYVAIYFGEAADRDVANAKVLMYRVYDTATKTWSEEAQVDADGTADASFDAVVYQDTLYVFYTQANKTFQYSDYTEDAQLVSDITFAQDAVLMRYDASSQTFAQVEEVALHRDDCYDMMPVLGVLDDVLYLAWNKNTGKDESAIFCMNTQNNVWTASFDGTAWTEPVCLVNDCYPIADMKLVNISDKVRVAIVADEDASLYTEDDRNLYFADMAGNVAYVNCYGGSVADLQTIRNGKTLLWLSNGKVMALSDLETGIYQFSDDIHTITDDYRAVEVSDTMVALVWSRTDSTTDVYISYLLEGSQWTKPTLLTYMFHYLMDYDVVVADGRVHLLFTNTYMLTPAESGEQLLSAYSKLFYSSHGMVNLLTQEDASLEINEEKQTVDITVTVTNNGPDTIQYMDVTLTDKVKEEVTGGTIIDRPIISMGLSSGYASLNNKEAYRYTLTKNKYTLSGIAVFLLPGQTKTLTVQMNIDSDMVLEDYDISVAIGEKPSTDDEDTGMDSGTSSLPSVGGTVVGTPMVGAGVGNQVLEYLCPDISVTGQYVIIEETEYISLRVVNTGDTDANATLFLYRLDDGVQTEVYTTAITSLMAGNVKYYLIKLEKDFFTETMQDFLCTVVCTDDSNVADNTVTIEARKLEGQEGVSKDLLVEAPVLTDYDQSFDKNPQVSEDLELDITMSDDILSFYGCIDSEFNPVDADYQESADGKTLHVTFRKEYLSQLENGDYTYSFLFQTAAGYIDAVYSVHVSDSTPIPVTGAVHIVDAVTGQAMTDGQRGQTLGINIDFVSTESLTVSWWIDGEQVSGDWTFFVDEQYLGKTIHAEVTGIAPYTGTLKTAEVKLQKLSRTLCAPVISGESAGSNVVLKKQFHVGDDTLVYGYSRTADSADVENWSASNAIVLPEDGMYYLFVKAPGSNLYEEAVSDPVLYNNTQSLKFSGASLMLQNNLAISYKVKGVELEQSGFEDLYVVFSFNGRETVVRDYTLEGDRYVFTFHNIAPNQMNDTITATLHATYEGNPVAGAPREYSVATYCYTQLNKYSADDYAELRTLLVDLLNYGAVSQQYTGYKTENLVSAALTEPQKSWATQTDRAYTNILTTKYETIENPTVAWKGGSLVLTEAVVMRLRFEADNTEGLSFKITSGGSTWWIDAYSTEGGSTYLYFNGLNAGQMSEEVFITAYQNGVAVSNTVRYSIESYASQKITDTATPYLSEIVDAMMKYGDSAYAYVH